MLCPRKYMAHHYICKYRIGNGLSLTACFCSNDCRTPDTIPPQAAPMGRTGGPRNFLRRPSRPSRKRDGFAWFLAPLLSEARLALGEATPGPDGREACRLRHRRAPRCRPTTSWRKPRVQLRR